MKKSRSAGLQACCSGGPEGPCQADLKVRTTSVRFLYGLFRPPCGIVLAAIVAACCGGGPTSPSPTPEAPKLTCPAPQTGDSRDGGAIAITYPPAIVSGGSAPLIVACVPASGSPFPVGSTVVTCTVADALQRTDTCTFPITVQAPPRLAATKFVAFGDSITEGKLSLNAFTLMTGLATAYPAVLESLLDARYTAQPVFVINEGFGGETAVTAQSRLSRVLTTDAPDVLLLQEGANDLATNRTASIQQVVGALRAMIREARGRGITVFVGTLLPQRAGGSNAGGAGLIGPANDQIRPMVTAEGAVLVDLYADFGGTAGSLIGADGLHPTVQGYQQIAESFYNVIRARLEVAGTAKLTGFAR